MNKVVVATVSAIAILASTPAWADCMSDLQNYNKDILGKNEYRARMTTSMSSDVRQLRDAAFILNRAKQDDACEEVVAAIKDMVETPGTASDSGRTYEEWNKTEIGRLQSAQTLDQIAGGLPADEIIGSDLRNLQNEYLGEIDDVLIATGGKGSGYAIVSHGGFLGLGEKQIAVPLSKLRITEDKDVFVLDASKEAMDKAPSFERDKFGHVANDAWRVKNDEYFTGFK
jgi:hypothetical protein